jgi:hypothetical protein
MSSSTLEIVSHGLNLWDLQRVCAARFDMRPSTTLAVADRLFENNAITYPRVEFRFLRDVDHVEGVSTLEMLAAASPKWKSDVGRTNPAYKSSAWVDDEVAQAWNACGICPSYTAEVTHFDKDEENVFSVIAERYIALFDPSRSSPGDTKVGEENVEHRRFTPRPHVKDVKVFGASVGLVGPEFFIDNIKGSIYLAVTDGVKGYAWLEIPFAEVSEFITSMRFVSIEDFARRNLPLLGKFVEEANETVIPGGGGLYVCAPNTYELRDGVRHYRWPRG